MVNQLVANRHYDSRANTFCVCFVRCFFICGCFVLSGCGAKGGPETFPVTGSIEMDGQPVAAALVVFNPSSSDASKKVVASQAETDDDGNFIMKTHIGGEDYKQGMQPGDYVVTVTKMEVVQDMRRQPKHLLPKKYRFAKSTDLKASVNSDGENHFEFVLE